MFTKSSILVKRLCLNQTVFRPHWLFSITPWVRLSCVKFWQQTHKFKGFTPKYLWTIKELSISHFIYALPDFHLHISWQNLWKTFTMPSLIAWKYKLLYNISWTRSKKISRLNHNWLDYFSVYCESFVYSMVNNNVFWLHKAEDNVL